MSAMLRGFAPHNKRFLKDFGSPSMPCFDKMGADSVKGSGRRICPASPCGARGAIQRAEKGSGFRTFQATEAPDSSEGHKDPFLKKYIFIDFENTLFSVIKRSVTHASF